MRHQTRLTTSIGLAYAAIFSAALNAAHISEVVVTGQGTYSDRIYSVDAADIEPAITDANALMFRVPGGASNDNGRISGQLQYRGLFGPRVGTTVNGIAIQSGGPNWMDPPLHYAPTALIERFEFSRGIASIADGVGIGGRAHAYLKRSRFTDGGPEFQGDLSFGGHTVDAGYNAGGIVALANQRHRIHILGHRDDGDDAKFGDGNIDDTQYERDFYGAGYGFQWAAHEIGIDYSHVDTGHSGTPVLPLDLAHFDTDIVGFNYHGTLGGMDVDLRLFYTDIGHQMDNFRQRSTPDFSALSLAPFVGTERRFVDVAADGKGFAFTARYAARASVVRTGVEGRMDENSASVHDPDVPAFFVTNFNGSETTFVSVFGEWEGSLSDRSGFELGARYLRTTNDSGRVDAQPAQFVDATPALCAAGAMPVPPPCAVRILRERFNASDHSRVVHEFDWAARFTYVLNSELNLELALARKTRAPTYIERYLWIPLEVNAGLGDGNNYVGHIDLDPEVAHKVDFGFDWRTATMFFAPRGFYHRVDDFIQGAAIPITPGTMPIIGVSTNANGDRTPLRFSNVDAELYGVDVLAGAKLASTVRSDAVFSYVRGKRRDIDDNLFRIAPPSLRLSLAYEQPLWLAQFETVFTARQAHIAQTITNDPGNPNNSNTETPGHVVLNLHGRLRLEGGMRVSFGLENLLNHTYRDHLSGFNRVLNSDVPRGQRLPGRGINGYVTVGYAW